MSYEQDQASIGYRPMAIGGAEARAAFIQNTYIHLLGAILAFIGIESFLFKSGMALRIAQAMLSTSWLLVLGGFVLVSWIATRVAHRAEGLFVQYLALTAYVLAEALIFVPILVIAELYAPGTIASAAWVTMGAFAALTAVVFLTKKDFSFLRTVLAFGGICALGLIVGGVIFGMNLGLWFSIAMVALAGGAILYDTSNIIHHYSEDRYVAAALQLFASVALMFWYVLRIFLNRR